MLTRNIVFASNNWRNSLFFQQALKRFCKSLGRLNIIQPFGVKRPVVDVCVVFVTGQIPYDIRNQLGVPFFEDAIKLIAKLNAPIGIIITNIKNDASRDCGKYAEVFSFKDSKFSTFSDNDKIIYTNAKGLGQSINTEALSLYKEMTFPPSFYYGGVNKRYFPYSPLKRFRNFNPPHLSLGTYFHHRRGNLIFESEESYKDLKLDRRFWVKDPFGVNYIPDDLPYRPFTLTEILRGLQYNIECSDPLCDIKPGSYEVPNTPEALALIERIDRADKRCQTITYREIVQYYYKCAPSIPSYSLNQAILVALRNKFKTARIDLL